VTSSKFRKINMTNIKHFLVHFSYDEHHDIFGIFNNIDLFINTFHKLESIQKARLYKNYQIDEYGEDNPCEVIDTIYVQDVIEYDELDEETKKYIT
jgi:hypothetical protein